MSALGELVQAKFADKAGTLYELGRSVGRLYTDHGLPIDMALDRLDLTQRQKLAVLDGALGWFIDHRRNSNATEKALDRQRRANREALQRFTETGETGVY